MAVIYKITNLKNGKIYVGQTRQNLSKRLYQHQRSKNIGIDAAIQKYGWENFSAEVIEECPEEMLNEREKFWIAELNSMFPNGYNLTSGGERDYTVAEPTRAKISELKTGNKNWLGKHHTAETKALLSAMRMGNKYGVGNKSMLGKHLSAETRAKMSVARKGRIFSAEHRANLSKASKGRKKSPETCAKLSAANKNPPTEVRARISERNRKIVYPILDAELEKRTMTRKFLAKNIGVNYQTLKRKLRGEITLDLKTAEKIRDFLGVDMTIEELFAKNENS